MFTSSVWIIVTALLELGARLGSCTQSSQNARGMWDVLIYANDLILQAHTQKQTYTRQ